MYGNGMPAKFLLSLKPTFTNGTIASSGCVPIIKK